MSQPDEGYRNDELVRKGEILQEKIKQEGIIRLHNLHRLWILSVRPVPMSIYNAIIRRFGTLREQAKDPSVYPDSPKPRRKKFYTEDL